MSDQNRKSNQPTINELLEQLEKVNKENNHLKKALAEVSVDKSILQEAVEIFKKKELKAALPSPKKSRKKGGSK